VGKKLEPPAAKKNRPSMRLQTGGLGKVKRDAGSAGQKTRSHQKRRRGEISHHPVGSKNMMTPWEQKEKRHEEHSQEKAKREERLPALSGQGGRHSSH